MQYRTLGKSDIRVSEIGFGCWPIGGGWGDQNDARDIAALRNAFDHGVNFYDTAMVYGNGHSEEVLGEAFAGIRDKVVIATKIISKESAELPGPQAYPADWIVKCTDDSLRRLKTDYIDVQQIHLWREHFTDYPDWLEALRKLKDQGKIRSIGISAEDWEWNGSVRVVNKGVVDSVQAIYNIFDQQPEERLFPAVIENNVGIIVRVPLFEGLLSGRIRSGHQFVKGDWRTDFFTPERLAQAEPKLRDLESLLDAQSPTLTALSLRFCLSHPAVSTVIVGMTKSDHVAANCAVSDGRPLSPEKLSALKKQAFDHGWVYPWGKKR